MEPLLTVRDIEAGYGKLTVLRNVSLDVHQGEFVSLLGPNGAGKTTTLRTISGFLVPFKGEITFKGESVVGKPVEEISRLGISFVSETLNLFRDMTVRDNLLMGAYQIKDKAARLETLDFVYGVFDRLQEREGQLAGTMSGGEQKMLAIARGLMSRPSLLLVDEPSLGLAPQLARDVFVALRVLQKEGVTILLVEQNARAALRITNRGYILENGRIVAEDASDLLRNDQRVRKAYLGR